MNLAEARGAGVQPVAETQSAETDGMKDLPLVVAAPPPAKVVSRKEKAFLYVSVSLILVFIGIELYEGLLASRMNFSKGLALAQEYYENSRAEGMTKSFFRPDIAMLYTLQYSRAQDAALIKDSALFLAFIIVMLGSLFVLYGAEAFYSLKISNTNVSSALSTSSPGLVLITIGAALVVFTLYSKSQFDQNVDWIFHNPDAAKQIEPQRAESGPESLDDEWRKLPQPTK